MLIGVPFLVFCIP